MLPPKSLQCHKLIQGVSNFMSILGHRHSFFFFFKQLWATIHIQFTHLECTIQWFLAYSQSCAAITTTDFRASYHPKKKSFWISGSQSPFTTKPLIPRHPLTYFLVLWNCLFGTFHINGITYVTLHAQFLSLRTMVSRFTQGSMCQDSIFQIAEEHCTVCTDHILLSIYQLMNTWVVFRY